MKKALLFGTLGLFALVAPAQATQIDGHDIYVTGEAQVGTWNPGHAATHKFWDDGATNGDAVSGDGIYTVVITGLTPGEVFQWKAASGGISPQWAREIPSGGNGNLVAHVPASGTITFLIDTNVQDDGWLPDAGGPATGIGRAYIDLTEYFAGATSFKLVGDFQEANGGTANWTPAGTGTITLTLDTGSLYTGTVTGLAAASYNYKALVNEDFNTALGAAGFGNGGPNLSFAAIAPTDNITFTFDASNSRITYENDNPLANPGPPFFAQSTAWGTAFTSVEELTADGDTYRKTFVVATPGQYSVRVRQGIGPAFPASGDYPFVTTEANQSVRVVFDRTVYADTDFSPNTDFVVVLDDATGFGLTQWTRIQPVGDFQTDFGATGNWDNNLPFMSATQTTEVGIWSVTLGAYLSGTGKQLKAVGNLLGDADTNHWKYQFGGPDDGVTINGNNTPSFFTFTGSDPTPINHTFWIDTITGRVGVSNTAPLRGSYIGIEPTAANVWQMYE